MKARQCEQQFYHYGQEELCTYKENHFPKYSSLQQKGEGYAIISKYIGGRVRTNKTVHTGTESVKTPKNI